jgi:hypothetical protein
MPNDEELYHCRVCGLRLDFPPWGEDGKSPTYEYCPCCGVEFGYGDATIEAIRTWRQRWLESGARWAEPEKKPPHWSLEDQLAEIPERFQ